MMSPYYAGGLGIPYMMGMGSEWEHCKSVIDNEETGYGMMNPYMMGMGMSYPYGMMSSNPYMYSGMVS